jgi:hypothetical protein
MQTRNLLELLRAELEFLELGGYEHALGAPWRPAFIFEDSPTCINFREASKRPCKECPLLIFVPPAHRDEAVPCRFIRLNPEGQTLHSLYASASHGEMLDAVRFWLKETIARLERTTKEEESPSPMAA